jgi:hypothetical protein
MPHILLFHSILGLRPVERDLAREWEAAGHDVTLPDLYEGRATDDYGRGFRLYREIGPAEVSARAAAAVQAAPEDAVLAGVSMGAGLVGNSWGARPRSKGRPPHRRRGPLVARPAPGPPRSGPHRPPGPVRRREVLRDWDPLEPRRRARPAPLRRPGHYFLDPALPDHDETAARNARAAMLAFLAAL